MKKLTREELFVPTLLVALSVVPMLGGIVRIASFSGPVTPDNARFLSAPVPVLLHIVVVALYSLLGAFQFSAGVRRRWPRWHRRAGRVLAVCGVVTALTGMYMAHVYRIPGSMQGPLLYGVRMLVGVSMATAIAVAWIRILRGNVVQHEAWMIRAYALGQGAGTQAVIMLPIILIWGECLGLARDLLLTLAWVINVVFAEWLIRRRALPRKKADDVRLATERGESSTP